MVWARTLDRELDLTAVYDPFFHDQVFKTMAASFSPERQEEVGLVKQEELHEQIIDDGLGELYRIFLDQAAGRTREDGLEAEARLRQGKAYRVLADEGKRPDVDLVVVGRFGQHREEGTPLGSNSEAVVRLCRANVLVTRAAPRPQGISDPAEAPLEWDPAAEKQLESVPAFARPMARSGVERAVRARGGDRITEKDFWEMAERMGMPRPDTTD
jgi:nucleotide-binding universal stress UspA family protein